MFKKIRKSYLTKGFAAYAIVSMLSQIVWPSISMALSSGPVDINQASFEPASTSEMVNMTTGDFTYNIPLLDVDGYPINLAYHGGVNMEQEASMVGLGWTLNVGSINRTKRGLPDDFNGDEITTTFKSRPRYELGGTIGGSYEFTGFDAGYYSGATASSMGFGVTFNNYTGYSSDLFKGYTKSAAASSVTSSLGIGMNSNSQGGLTINTDASIGLSSNNLGVNVGVGTSLNTLEGIQSVNLTGGISANYSSHSHGISRTAVIPVSTVSYTPSIAFETISTSENFDFSFGGSVYANDFQGQSKGFRSLTCNKRSIEIANGYGYLYGQNQPQNELTYLSDFNEEGQVIPNEKIPNLPITNHTFDVFNSNAQGLGFTFRPHRSDVGVLGNMQRRNIIVGGAISIEAGVGGIAQNGINLNATGGTVESGKWVLENPLNVLMSFTDNAPSPIDNNLFEPFYFKKYGNRSGVNPDFYNTLGDNQAIKQKIEKYGKVNHKGTSEFVSKFGSSIYDASTWEHYQAQRQLRNTCISYLNAEMASEYGQSKEIPSYEMNNSDYLNGTFVPQNTYMRFGNNSEDAKEHHLSEMTVLKGDGSRYVYGIPVVNEKTEEVMFNVSDYSDTYQPPLSRSCEKGLVEYGSGTDNSIANSRGDNNLFLKKEIPAYASSYLLTAYLSSNYVDKTNNGPTPDDLGAYTKFNYSKETNNTKWRVPFEEDQAAYNERLKSNNYDDLGTYIYGEREQWYIHSIETKNFVAQFFYDERRDGYGVEDENGGISTTNGNQAKKLVKIELHSRNAKKNNGAPIKSVHFEYDYELCPNVPNNDGQSELNSYGQEINSEKGKLTLKSIYFTYGNSKRGKLHKYEFDYGTNNPEYSRGMQDRWGTYQEIEPNTECDETGTLSNFEYPYTDQDKSQKDLEVSAWALSEISLPSGSEIKVKYESDDYAYVQNYEATRMFVIKGFSHDNTFDQGEAHELYTYPANPFASTPNQYLHVDVGDLGADLNAAKNSIKNDYLTGDKLFIKSLVEITPAVVAYTDQAQEARYEYVSAYLDVETNIDDIHVYSDGGTNNCVAFKLKQVGIDDQGTIYNQGIANPLSKAAWQFTRKYNPSIINPNVGSIYDLEDIIDCDYEFVPPHDVLNAIFSPNPQADSDNDFMQNMLTMGISHLQNIQSLGGINFMMALRGYSRNIVPEKTWIKLRTGNGIKLGGGHRVAKIEVEDKWDQVKSMESPSTYGTKYSYTTIRERDGLQISSGVASYEPIIAGGEENAMRRPLEYSVPVLMRVDDEEFQEWPFGESIFGNSTVVYSEIKVENIDYANVTQSSTGQTVYEHYTAKDFPVRFDRTGDASEGMLQSKSNWTAIFTGKNYNYLAMSQGFYIGMNDMHGKFKGKKVFSESINSSAQSLVYELKHKYLTHASDENWLSPNVSMVDENGDISNGAMGLDLDVVVNLNETKSIYKSNNYDVGIDGFLIGPYYITAPSLFVNKYEEKKRFRSSVTTKVAYQSGILQKIELFDKGRKKVSENLVFDRKTGVPVITQINHETENGSGYDVPIYQYDYPAYWMYEGMGLASENIGVKFIDVVNSSGLITVAGANTYFNAGDEIAVRNTTQGIELGRYWVLEDEVNGGLYLIDINGQLATFTSGSSDHFLYTIIRSGKRNFLGSTAQSVTSLVKNVTTAYTAPHSKVLNASSVEYTDRAFAHLADKSGEIEDSPCGLAAGQIANPYVNGLRANWNLLASYVYQDVRDQTNGRIREDGIFLSYLEYWVNNSGTWGVNTNSLISEKWIKAATATIFNPEGYNLESKDALGIYSSILLGYNNTLKIAEAVNARYNEIGFNGFEDIVDYRLISAVNCNVPHFDFEIDENNLIHNVETAHTGRYSLLLPTSTTTVRNSDVLSSLDYNSNDHAAPYQIEPDEVVLDHCFVYDAESSNKYVFTLWAKEEMTSGQILNYDGVDVDIIQNSASIVNKEIRSSIIDGWQRIEIQFTIPSNTGGVSFELSNTGSNNIYVDDIRVQPFNSEMVSYVIDPLDLRLWATLDSRNFATFYQYDEEGSLVRIIQETEKGRVTVQENRAGIRINNQ